jgi:post-segregation antitoxin (ccd killing protein)
MKQNITLSLDKELIQKAKILAANLQTSVSGFLSAELRKAIKETSEYESAKRRALSDFDKGFHLGGGICVSRENLHER